tara:strand:+ start:360 stop:590 length:231 start_codon:yes stop_codon:yes gene_type:complete
MVDGYRSTLQIKRVIKDMKHIIITLMLASVVMASDEQKKHDDAWKKVIEKRKQLEKTNQELEKTIQEIIKKLKKIN